MLPRYGTPTDMVSPKQDLRIGHKDSETWQIFKIETTIGKKGFKEMNLNSSDGMQREAFAMQSPFSDAI
jgi:hypothetical protein